MSDFNAPNSISAGAPHQTPRGAYRAPPDPLAGFKGHTSKGRLGEGRGGERKGDGRRGKEGKGGRMGHFSSAGLGPQKHVKTALLTGYHFSLPTPLCSRLKPDVGPTR